MIYLQMLHLKAATFHVHDPPSPIFFLDFGKDAPSRRGCAFWDGTEYAPSGPIVSTLVRIGRTFPSFPMRINVLDPSNKLAIVVERDTSKFGGPR